MGKKARKSMWETAVSEQANLEQIPSTQAGEPAEAVSRPPAAQSVMEKLRTAEKKQRNRNWENQEANQPMLFRRVSPALRDSVKEIANDLNVRVDDVARAFLEYGLLCYQKGDLQISPILSDGRLTLFPKSRSRWDKSTLPGWYERLHDQQPQVKKTRKSKQTKDCGQEKPWKWQVSYRGIPPALKSMLLEIHEKKSIPLGEVATLFLGHSLDAYYSGRLVLNPQARHPSILAITERQVQ